MREFSVNAALAIALCFANSAPSVAETMTLKTALGLAYETNPDLGGARAGVRAVDEGVAQANSGWRPSISASSTYGVQHGEVTGLPTNFNSRPLSAQIAVTEQIFRGGRTFAEVAQAIAKVRSARAQLADVERSVLINGVTAYMDVVRDVQTVGLNRKNVSALQSLLDATQTQHAAGAVTITDVDQAQARLARARADLAAAEQQLGVGRATFEAVIGQPAATLETSPSIPRLPGSQDMARNIGVQQSPRVLQAKADLRAADFAVADAAGALLPQLSVTGQYQYLQDAGGTNIFATNKGQKILSVVGQLTVPIYQGGAEEATVRQAKQLRGEAQMAVQSAERVATQDVDTAWQALQAARTQIFANEQQVKADQHALDGVTQEQQGGERSILDVLNAQQELLSAQVSMVAAQHDYIVAAYRLSWATGELSSRTLALDVKYYDPHTHYEESGSLIDLGD